MKRLAIWLVTTVLLVAGILAILDQSYRDGDPAPDPSAYEDELPEPVAVGDPAVYQDEPLAPGSVDDPEASGVPPWEPVVMPNGDAAGYEEPVPGADPGTRDR